MRHPATGGRQARNVTEGCFPQSKDPLETSGCLAGTGEETKRIGEAEIYYILGNVTAKTIMRKVCQQDVLRMLCSFHLISNLILDCRLTKTEL